MNANEKVNILIVDDKPANLLALENILKNPGLNIVRANSGNEALAALLELDFACMILDVKMPEMDGFELAQIIRDDERTKYIPIIFASGHQYAEADVFKGYETGAVDYLLKPLDPRIVRSKINVFAELYRKELARSRAEALLAEYAKDLRRSNDELDQFASIAAHDLQAPLRAILSYAEILNEECREKLGEEAQDYLGKIIGNAERMRVLIRELLAFSKVGRKQPAIKFDVHSVVTEVTKDLAQAITESGAKIIPMNLPTILASPLEFHQLLLNLISNAIKYRRKDISPEVYVSAANKGELWHFSVRDNGIGIDPQYENKLFILFSRLHSASDYPGTGIGLAICKKIVDRHGGKIWIESQPGKGSIFHFTLPVRELGND